MRLLTRKLWRAFPELDRYSDEQCRQFVAAAAGSVRRRVARLAAAITASLLWAAVPIGVLIGVAPAKLSMWVPPLWPFFVVLPSPAIGYITRDVLLRFRVRSVLRDRGACIGCRYSLIGVRVSESLIVTCPECGATTEVDSSLNELVLSNDGTRSFEPSAQHGVAPLLPPRLALILKRVAIGSAAVVIVGGGLFLAGYEYFLRKQAARATADRPGAAGATALVIARQPKDADESPENNAWSALLEAITLRASIENAGRKASSLRTSDGKEPYPDYLQIYADAPASGSPEFSESVRLSRELALEIMPRLRDGGLYDAMRAITTRTHAVRPLQCPPGQPLFMTTLTELSHCRTLGRINFARMHLALAANDPDEFADAFEAALAIARVTRLQCFGVDWQVAAALESEALTRARAALTTHPLWHARLLSVFHRQASDVAIADAFDGEGLAARDLAAWAFSDPDTVRFGRRAKMLGPFIAAFGADSDSGGKLGTYASLLAETNAYLDAWTARIALPRWRRDEAPRPDTHSLEHALLRMTAPDFERVLDSSDNLLAGRAAFFVMVALEQFRAARGRYPESLNALVPEYLASLPADPFTGDLPRYRLIDPASDPHGRAYLAYFVGPDKTDNHGVPNKRSYSFDYFRVEATSSVSDTDLVFNDPR